ncbi:MAG: reprolysin-like metallopeptidase [Cryomorphaceae bacterium]
MRSSQISTVFAALFVIIFQIDSFGQQGGDFGLEFNYLGRDLPVEAQDRDADIHVEEGSYFEIHRTERRLLSEAISASDIVMLPSLDGSATSFSVARNNTMSEGLQEQFPDITTANIVSIEDPSVWGKIDFTPRGMHAIIFQPGRETLFIDPVSSSDPVLHVMYRRGDFITDKVMYCSVAENTPGTPLSQAGAGQPYNSCELRTYRIAISASGEYTIFHGGEVEDAVSAIVTTMNRVNGVYERDFGVTMTIIPNNAELIFTNPGTDPFTNGSPGQMINENQVLTNNVIGAANYDIGHVFGTNSGGLAGLGVTCNDNFKARGVTGSAAPVGDPFDIDYVAHEIGHQFNSNHCFNNACGGNRNNATAAEPGSGSTIMAYAGICNPNVQANSDDHFHGISMREIGLRVQSDNCPVVESIDNSAPNIQSVTAEMWIPAGTPFELSAQVTDAEDDAISYNWEQMDVEISTQPPVASSQSGPNFRSFSPSEVPERMFPGIEALISGASTVWERLPGVSREMNFRLSVRDNNPFTGCNQFADVVVNVEDTGEPFELIAPNSVGVVWPGLSYQEVVWNVAGTDAAPVNAETVDIFLSTTSTPAFDSLVAAGVPNTGSYFILTPNIATTTARIMVRASNQPFFDLSAFNFTITTVDEGFFFETESPLSVSGCSGSEFEFNIAATALSDLPGPITLDAINLPDGISVLFDPVVVEPGQGFTATVVTELNAPSGLNDIQITGSSGAFFNDIFLLAELVSADPQPATPEFPENEETAAGINTALQWSANAGLGELYTVELALDDAFNEIVFSQSELSETAVIPGELLPETEYFWRTRNDNECAVSDFSEVFSFTTVACASASEVNVTIPEGTDGATSVQSVTTIGESGEISSVNVTSIQGSHSDGGQLFFSLTGPQGISAELGTVTCGAEVTIRGSGSVGIQVPGQSQENFQSSTPSGFGPGIGSGHLIGQAVLAIDGNGLFDAELCDPALNPQALSGKIAVVTRGECQFVQKVFQAQEAGGIGAIIINNQGNNFFSPGGNQGGITIPSVMVGLETGNALLSLLAEGAQSFAFGFDDFAEPAGIDDCADAEITRVQPIDPLEVFNGEEAQGDWTLTVENSIGTGSGSLDSWTLQVCLELENDPLSTTAVNDFDLEVFPNPTTGEVFARWQGSADFDNLRIMDLQGVVVMVKNVRGTDRVNFDLSHLSTGVYVLQLSGAKSTEVHKLVLTR